MRTDEYDCPYFDDDNPFCTIKHLYADCFICNNAIRTSTKNFADLIVKLNKEVQS